MYTVFPNKRMTWRFITVCWLTDCYF